MTLQGQYRFEGPAFPTISALIAYQYNNGQPVTSRSGAILRHPIPRERWELNNDDIILQDKIGRVSNSGKTHTLNIVRKFFNLFVNMFLYAGKLW